MTVQKTVVIIGGGLAGLVAAHELVKRGKHVTLIEQEDHLGGQAWWSLGGLFCVNSPIQQQLGVKDSEELALQDWLSTAEFEPASARSHEAYPQQWAHNFVHFATHEMQPYLAEHGVELLPRLGWAERRRPDGLSGNTVPRFHLTIGCGPKIARAFAEPIEAAAANVQVEIRLRHRVTELIQSSSGEITGVRGDVLESTSTKRGLDSNRNVIEPFSITSTAAVVISSGGIGSVAGLVRGIWKTPELPLLIGVPSHVDGEALSMAAEAGAQLTHSDKLWAYAEGVGHWSPKWPNHGVRVIAGPSSLWLDAHGHRFPSHLYPGSDTLAALQHVLSTGHHYSWLITTREILQTEVGLSGSEHNQGLTAAANLQDMMQNVAKYPKAVEDLLAYSPDVLFAPTLEELIPKMQALTRDELLDVAEVRSQVRARDTQLLALSASGADPRTVIDPQYASILSLQGNRFLPVVPPHRLDGAERREVIAIRCRIMTRKTLGGIATDLSSRVLTQQGEPLPNLYAAGEAAGFGGGGVHGRSALEGTFLTGCIFTGKVAAEAIARDI